MARRCCNKLLGVLKKRSQQLRQRGRGMDGGLVLARLPLSSQILSIDQMRSGMSSVIEIGDGIAYLMEQQAER